VAGIDGAPRGSHRALHIGAAAIGHLGQCAAVDRADAGKARAIGGVHVTAIDEGLAMHHQRIGLALPFLTGTGSGHRGLQQWISAPFIPTALTPRRDASAIES